MKALLFAIVLGVFALGVAGDCTSEDPLIEECHLSFLTCVANETQNNETEIEKNCKCYGKFGFCLSTGSNPCIEWAEQSGEAFRMGCILSGCKWDECNESSVLTSSKFVIGLLLSFCFAFFKRMENDVFRENR